VAPRFITWLRLRDAALDTLPQMGSIIVSFMTVGAAARAAGLSLVEATAMTAFVFAAPAQLVMVGMVHGGAGPGVVGVAVLVINLRLSFMSLSVVSSLRKVPVRRLLIWCAMLSGLSFTRFQLTDRQADAADDIAQRELNLAVSCVLLYLAAVVSTVVGSTLAVVATPVWIEGLNVMVAMMLIGRIVEARHDRPFFVAAALCALLTPVAAALSPNFGSLLLALSLSGLVAATPLALVRRQGPRQVEKAVKP